MIDLHKPSATKKTTVAGVNHQQMNERLVRDQRTQDDLIDLIEESNIDKNLIKVHN